MRSNSLRIWTLVGLCSSMLLLSSCSSLSYYSQSVIGHSRLMLARQSVDSLIEKSEGSLRTQLLLSKQLREFSVTELKLPKTKSYTTYVDLKREYPVWTVVATPEFSLDAKQWCYPVIGCAAYRGYFKESAARAYALKMQSRGLETDVGGTPAYSTLGWFSDPLLPSMMRYGDIEFAETLFHEIAHQQLYINGDSDFNEAFATLIGEVGVIRWLNKHRPLSIASYEKSRLVRKQFYSLVFASKDELADLYRSELEPSVMKAKKIQILNNLKQQYQQLVSDQWNGQAWYKGWFEEPLNNAKFTSLATYRDRLPELRALLETCEQDLARFYQVLASAEQHNGKVIVPGHCSLTVH